MVIEGGLGSFSNVQLVAAGKSDVAHVASPALLQAVAQGAKIKMVASFIQILGSGIMAKPEIKSVQDFCGKTMGAFNFDITSTLFRPTREPRTSARAASRSSSRLSATPSRAC